MAGHRHVEVYRSAHPLRPFLRWRWRLVGGNGEIMAASQAYTRKASAVRGAHAANPDVPVEVS